MKNEEKLGATELAFSLKYDTLLQTLTLLWIERQKLNLCH